MASEAIKVPFVEAAAPSTPAAGRVVIYAKSDGLLYSKDDAGTETLVSGGAGGGGGVAGDAIWDAAGDLAVGSGANTAAKLTVGASGTVPASNGTTLAYVYPPGYEFDHVAITSAVSPNATTEATANTVVTGNAVTYDGSTAVWVEFYSPTARPDTGAATRVLSIWLYDGSSSIGEIGRMANPAASGDNKPLLCRVRLTPSNAAHTYSIRASVNSGTGNIGAGAGGAAALYPAYLRITKA